MLVKSHQWVTSSTLSRRVDNCEQVSFIDSLSVGAAHHNLWSKIIDVSVFQQKLHLHASSCSVFLWRNCTSYGDIYSSNPRCFVRTNSASYAWREYSYFINIPLFSQHLFNIDLSLACHSVPKVLFYFFHKWILCSWWFFLSFWDSEKTVLIYPSPSCFEVAELVSITTFSNL